MERSKVSFKELLEWNWAGVAALVMTGVEQGAYCAWIQTVWIMQGFWQEIARGAVLIAAVAFDQIRVRSAV